jgi:hypothetical protein
VLPPCPFPTLGFEVIDWMETYLVHGPGDVQLEDYVLDDERALHILWAYALYPAGQPRAGRRMVLRDILSRAKGWAKSELAGAIACAEALGPVRFDGWDANGDPVGRPVTYPFIRCLATEEEQSGNTYDNVVMMLGEGEAANAYAIDPGVTKTIIHEPGGGEIVPSTSGSASKDGGKESFAVADETHLYITRGLREMHRTVARNTGKRKDAEPWMLDTSTAYGKGELSVMEKAADAYADKPVDDVLRTSRVLYDHQQGPDVKNWRSNRELKAALKIAYGDADFVPLDRVIALIRMPEATEAESRRYFLNQATEGDRIWIAPEHIDAMVDRGAGQWLEPGELITLGFDGSRLHDATVLFACRIRDMLLFPLGVWEKPRGPAGDGWEVPADDVDDAVQDAYETYRVERGYFDPPFWRDEIARWHAKYGDPVAKFETAQETQMAGAVGAAKTLITRGAVSLGGDPELVERCAEHFKNARTRKVRVKLEDEAEQAHVIEKDRKGSPNKMDGAVSGTLALIACEHAIADGALDRLDPPDPSLYRIDFLDEE